VDNLHKKRAKYRKACTSLPESGSLHKATRPDLLIFTGRRVRFLFVKYHKNRV
jgi:hypothetical protein